MKDCSIPIMPVVTKTHKDRAHSRLICNTAMLFRRRRGAQEASASSLAQKSDQHVRTCGLRVLYFLFSRLPSMSPSSGFVSSAPNNPPHGSRCKLEARARERERTLGRGERRKHSWRVFWHCHPSWAYAMRLVMQRLDKDDKALQARGKLSPRCG